MPHLPAAILVFVDRPHPTRQYQLALEFAASHQLRVASICPTVDAALALVLAGLIAAVISALPTRDGGALEKAGAQLFILRAPPPKRRTVDRVIARLSAAGLDTQAIAYALDLDPAEVRHVRRRRPNGQ